MVSVAKIKSQPSLVIGGEPIDITEVPWQVSLEYNNNHICGGVILNEEWVLTATHCLCDEFGNQTIFTGDDVKIHAGSTIQTDNSTGQRIEIDLIVTHPNWTPSNGANDIALLHLKKPLCFNDSVKLVSINGGFHIFEPETIGFTSGWGDLGSGCCSPQLYGAEMNFINSSNVISLYNSYSTCGVPVEDWINAGKICFYTDGISAGKGDSGGPVVVDINGIPTLVGITHGTCNASPPLLTLPTLFTDVGLQSTFINTHIAPKDITINTSQTNLDRSVINGNIIVKSPAVLTINTNIYMMPGMEIIVENGAQLILDGGRITSIDGDCSQPTEDKKWKGIRAIGNPFMISQNITSVEIKNGAIIENAVTGINTSNLVFGGLFGALNYSGAKITIDNSSILNCNTGINMGPFGYYDVELFPGYNISSEEESYIQDAYIQAKVGIRLNGNRGFEVKENTTIQHDVSTHPVGIWATNSKFSVDKTEFTGMNYPIVSTYSYPYPEGSVISESMFDSPTMIHWDNNSNLISPTIFHENDFYNGGIFMVGNNLFDITKNTFSTGSSAIEIVGTGALNETYIKNNLFDGVVYGVYAKGENGTEINENCFEQIVEDNIQLYDEAQIFYDQGDFENAAGNCFDKSKTIFAFGTGVDSFIYWIKNATPQLSCKHPDFPNAGEPWILNDLSFDENAQDCGSSGISGGGGWNYGYRKCNLPDSIHLMINMEASLKNQIIATQNNSGLSEWAKKRELSRLRRCLKSVIGKITTYRLITETDREAAINYLSAQDIFEVKIGAFGLMMHSGEHSRADSFLTTLTYTTDAELDFNETQQIYLDFLSHRDTSLVDALDKNVLYTIGNKKHGFAGFARSVYSEITGEIIPVTTPKLGESEPRTRKDNFPKLWTVSPNPFHSLLRVTTLQDSETKIDITVYNTLGIMQHQSSVYGSTIDIQTDTWSSGIYYLEININDVRGYSKLVRI